MVAITLNGQDCSLELPPDCLTVADATSYAKRKLGAAWADVPDADSIMRFTGSRLSHVLGVNDTCKLC